MLRPWIALFVLTGAVAQSAATMKQVMLDFIHPASNDILFFVSRAGPKTDLEWTAIRRSALALAEAGNLLAMPGRARDQNGWIKDARALADVGTAAYQAAQAKDLSALSALTESLDASCTTCHKHYRPNVFPREGASK
jgi:hypothetical protein